MSLTSIKAKKLKNHGQRALKTVVREKDQHPPFFYEPKLLLGSSYDYPLRFRKIAMQAHGHFLTYLIFKAHSAKFSKKFFFSNFQFWALSIALGMMFRPFG